MRERVTELREAYSALQSKYPKVFDLGLRGVDIPSPLDDCEGENEEGIAEGCYALLCRIFGNLPHKRGPGKGQGGRPKGPCKPGEPDWHKSIRLALHARFPRTFSQTKHPLNNVFWVKGKEKKNDPK